MSNRVAASLLSPNLRPRPIDCRLRILDLEGEEKITLCRLRMLTPVLKVPYEATMIASSSL